MFSLEHYGVFFFNYCLLEFFTQFGVVYLCLFSEDEFLFVDKAKKSGIKKGKREILRDLG